MGVSTHARSLTMSDAYHGIYVVANLAAHQLPISMSETVLVFLGTSLHFHLVVVRSFNIVYLYPNLDFMCCA